MVTGYIFSLICGLSLYSAYHSVAKARDKSSTCVCMQRLFPEEANADPVADQEDDARANVNRNAQRLNDLFDRYDRNLNREDAAGEERQREEHGNGLGNHSMALLDLLYRTNMGLMCLDDRSCALSLFLVFRAAALLTVLGLARNYDWAPILLGGILVVDYDPVRKRFGLNVNYVIGFLFITVVSIVRDNRGFGQIFALRRADNGIGATPVAYADTVAVRRDQKGRFSAIEARK